MKRYGRQTPTRSRILPYLKTDAERVKKLYERSGRKSIEWQTNLLDPIMSKNADDLWVHMKFGFSVPRQNGKNEVIAMVELDGLFQGEKILHTAHRTNTSAVAFDRLLSIMEEMGLKEDTDFTKIKAVGREHIKLIGGGLINFRTRTSTGGLGESYDTLVIDEAQEYTDDQESTLKYTIAASPNPRIIFTGTPPTPVSSGTVFTALRKQALIEKAEDLGWAEWSIDDLSDIKDVDLWYETNPSLGHRLTERTVRSETGEDEVDFNIQRLGLWLTYNQKSVISTADWQALKVKRVPKVQGKLFVGVKYGYDGINVAMSIALKTSTGKIFVEAIDCQPIRNGNDWILSFLKNADIHSVVIDGANGQNLLASEMKDIRLKKPILPKTSEFIDANSLFEQSIYQESIAHKGQPSLEIIATNVEKRKIGTSGGFGYKSQIDDFDIALLDSVILAHWACQNAKPVRKQKISY